MSKAKMFLTVIAVLLVSSNLFAANCMFVASTDPLTEGDQVVFDKLTAMGHTCTAVLSADLEFLGEADYADYDFIFSSESVGSTSLFPLKTVPIPLVNSEGWASKPSSLAWSDPASSENLAPEPGVIVAGGHFLAGGLADGDVIDLCSDPAGLIVPTVPTIDVIPVLALESDPTKLLAYGVEAGTVLTDGEVTMNRAAGVHVHEFGYLSLTDAAWTLYGAAINWVLGLDKTTDPVVGDLNCMFVASTDPLTEGDQLVFDALVAKGYGATVVLSADLEFFGDADYADFDFIFASESVGSTSLFPLKTVPIPLLNSEGWASKPSSLAWSDPASSENLAPEPGVIVAGGHFLAGGLADGDVIDLCSDPAGLIVPTVPTIDVIPVLALESDPTKLLAYGVEKGTVLTDGEVTLNRAAGVHIHEFGYLSLTDAAWTLYDAAILWILGLDKPSAVEDGMVALNGFELGQNYPNPFNPVTNIAYSIEKQSKVSLVVWDALGKEIATLVNDVKAAGRYTVQFDASSVPSGIYFYRLEAGDLSVTKKMSFVK